MSEARKIVLRLLADGKITIQEAEGLLDSIKDNKNIKEEVVENDLFLNNEVKKIDSNIAEKSSKEIIAVSKEAFIESEMSLNYENDKEDDIPKEDEKSDSTPVKADELVKSDASIIAIIPETLVFDEEQSVLEYKREVYGEKEVKEDSFKFTNMFSSIGLPRFLKGTQYDTNFTGVLNREIEIWNLKFNSFAGDVKISTWDEPFYKVTVKVRVKGRREPVEARRLIESKISLKAENGIICIKGLDERFVGWAYIEAYFPNSFIYNVEITESSGEIFIENIDSKTVNVNTSKGKVYINRVSAVTIDASTASGAMFISADASIIRGNVVNGSIKSIVNNSKPARISLDANRGNIKMLLGNSSNLGYDVKCETKAGEVRISGKGISKSNQKNLSGSKRIAVRTDSFDVNSDNIMIEANSIYGFIVVDSQRPLILA